VVGVDVVGGTVGVVWEGVPLGGNGGFSGVWGFSGVSCFSPMHPSTKIIIIIRGTIFFIFLYFGDYLNIFLFCYMNP